MEAVMLAAEERIIMKCEDNRSSLDGLDSHHLWDPNNVVGKIGACVIVVIISTGTVGNVLVLMAVCVSPKLRKSYNVFIAALSITDLIFNVVIMPFYADSYIHRDWRFSTLLCRFNTFFGTIVVISSSLHIASIAVNRYVLIVHQDWYARWFSKRAIALEIGLIWISSFAIVLPGILGWHAKVRYSDQIGRCNYVRFDSKGSLYLVFGLGFILPCVVILYCYVQISVVVYRSKKKLDHYRKRAKDRQQDAFSLNGMRPRCRTMPEGKEARRLVKAVTSKVAMLNLLSSGTLLVPSPYSSSDDVCNSRSHTPESTALDNHDCDIPRTTPEHCLNRRASQAETWFGGMSTRIPNGEQPPMCATDSLLFHRPSESAKNPRRKRTPSDEVTNPIITLTTEDSTSGQPTKTTKPRRRMSQSLTCLEIQSTGLSLSKLHGSIRAHLFPRRLKRHTMPREKVRHQTTMLNKSASANCSFLHKIHQRHHHKRHFKSFKMILAVFLGFSLTYLPFTILNFADEHSCLNRAWYMFTSLLFWSGACINPWIYGIMNTQFRDAYHDLICVCKRKGIL